MFQYRESQQLYWFNGLSKEPASMFELFGSIVALAMYNRTDSKVLYLEMPLAPVIFKLLLGGKPTMDDFAVW
jgi:hypothetical protein